MATAILCPGVQNLIIFCSFSIFGMFYTYIIYFITLTYDKIL